MLRLLAYTCASTSAPKGADIETAVSATLTRSGVRQAQHAAIHLRNHLARTNTDLDIVMSGMSVGCVKTAQIVAGVREDDVYHAPDFSRLEKDESLHLAIDTLEHANLAAYEKVMPNIVAEIGTPAWRAVYEEAEMYNANVVAVFSEPGLVQAMLVAVPGSERFADVIRETHLGHCEGFEVLFNKYREAVSVTLLKSNLSLL